MKRKRTTPLILIEDEDVVNALVSDVSVATSEPPKKKRKVKKQKKPKECPIHTLPADMFSIQIHESMLAMSAVNYLTYETGKKAGYAKPYTKQHTTVEWRLQSFVQAVRSFYNLKQTNKHFRAMIMPKIEDECRIFAEIHHRTLIGCRKVTPFMEMYQKYVNKESEQMFGEWGLTQVLANFKEEAKKYMEKFDSGWVKLRPTAPTKRIPKIQLRE